MDTLLCARCPVSVEVERFQKKNEKESKLGKKDIDQSES